MSEGYVSGNKQTIFATAEYEGSADSRLKAALLKIEQLKTVIEDLEQDRDYYEHRCDDLESDIIELEEQRDSLKEELKEEKVGHGLSIDTGRKLESLLEKQVKVLKGLVEDAVIIVESTERTLNDKSSTEWLAKAREVLGNAV